MADDIKTADILKIIRECRLQGVKKFTYKGIEMELEPTNPWNPTIIEENIPKKFAKMSDTEFNTMKDQGEIQQSMASVEDVQDFLHIEDPFGYEQAIMERELVNEKA
jgi:hypothetical protein